MTCISLQKNILRVIGLYHQCHRRSIRSGRFIKTYIKLENRLLKAAKGSDLDSECNDAIP